MYLTEPYAATAAITIRLGGIDPADVHVLELRGREGLNELFEYTVRVSTKVPFDLSAILKSGCTIEIAAGTDGRRYIHGLVAAFERLEQRGGATDYAARVVPLHWVLTKRYCSRIFQAHNCPDMTIAGIIRKVLLNAGIPADRFRFVIPGEQKAREYVVQYRETEWDFVSRLMEEEGLACYFEHTEVGHTLVIGEAPALFRENPIYPQLTYCDPNGMDVAAECVYRIHERRSVEYGIVGLTDYNFKLPGLDLRQRYPGGMLPSNRYSSRTAPPPRTHCGPAAPPPDYEADSPEYGEPSASYDPSDPPAYGPPPGSGYGGQPSGPGYGDRPAPPASPAYNGAGRGPAYGSGGSAGNGYGAGSGYGASPPPSNGYPQGDQPSAPWAPPDPYAAPGGESPRGRYDPTLDRTPYQPNPQETPGYGGQEREYRGASYGARPTPPGYGYRPQPPAPPAHPYPPAPPQTPPPPPMDYGCSAIKVDYPGAYLERPDGSRRAQLQQEEHQAAAAVFEMTANVRGLSAGYLVTLQYHAVEELNAEYLVTGLVIEAEQSQGTDPYDAAPGGFRFEVQVRAIPAQVRFRPPCRTPRPCVRGAQTALVVGPASDEIHTDAYGRVKVQFHWDPDGCYDEYSSCWIRVSQGMAGGQYGMMFLPRVGQEVIVDFLEGNPDRPIITGRVYNGDCMPPYKLPDYKTRSCIRTQSSQGGYGANEIRFEDRKDYEHLLVYAQRELHLRSRANCHHTVGGHNHSLVYGNHYEKIQKKSNVEVCLDRNEKVGGNQSLTVRGDVAERIYGKHSESCAAYSLKTESGEVVIEAATGITLKVGGNFIKIDSAGVHVVGTLINLNSGGTPGIAYLRPPQLPYAPKPACGTEYGYDMRYATTPTPPPEDGYGSPSYPEPGPPPLHTPESWIEIELVDESGRPWPHEPYELATPDGSVHNGTLDANGLAHVRVETDGECQIRFPNLDQAAWERI